MLFSIHYEEVYIFHIDIPDTTAGVIKLVDPQNRTFANMPKQFCGSDLYATA